MYIRKRIALLLALALALAAGALAEASDLQNATGVFQFTASDDDSVFASERGGSASEDAQPDVAVDVPLDGAEASDPQGDEESDGGPVIPTATLSPKVAELPWNLMLVNKDNPVPDDWQVELVTLDNGRQVDKRILPDLQRMFDDCRKAGLKPTVYTAYRSYQDQQDMLISKYHQYKNQGLSHEKAQAAALKVANYPGYSEHQLGLAVDIDSANTEVCSNESVWKWMQRHCQDYGFIWRYPKVKTSITGINNEDWHFRYVGVEAATEIMTNRLCLEEYLQQNYGIEY